MSDSSSDESSARKRRALSQQQQQQQLRVRPRGGPSHITSIPVDEHGRPYEIEEDEVVLPADAAGDRKVTKLGYLNGGREYRCRTFTILGRGQRLYMLSTEPARCMGFRDSYLFLQKHRQLYKMIMDDDEKYDMIRRDIIPHSYKGRAIGVISARSIFREFGAKIVVGGRSVLDDYYEASARMSGAPPGQLADPDDKLPPPGIAYNRNQYVAWHGASSVYHTAGTLPPAQSPGAGSAAMPQQILPKKKKVPLTTENWMAEHARAASGFNEMLHAQRAANFACGIYEPHTNIHMLPRISQPTRARWAWEGGEAGVREAVVATWLEEGVGMPGPGLLHLDPQLLETCSEEVKTAIRLQQERERQAEAGFAGGERQHGLRARLKV